MSLCPFFSESKEIDKMSGCITTCELRVENHCALRILAQKALFDAKQAKLQAKSQVENVDTDTNKSV